MWGYREMWIRPSVYCQGMQREKRCRWYWTDVILRLYVPGRSTRRDRTHWVGEQVGYRPCLNVRKNWKVFIRNYTNGKFLYWDSGKMSHWLTSPRPSTVPTIGTYASFSKVLNAYSPVPTSRKQKLWYNLTYFIYLQCMFYTNIDIHSVMMTYKKRSKHVGVLEL
jgi:hypothetical protein